MKVSQLIKTRVVVAMPFVLLLSLTPTKSVALVVTTSLFAALMAPLLMLLIRCRRCDGYVMESVCRTPGHLIPVLFFTPYLRCVKCGATLGRPYPYEEK